MDTNHSLMFSWKESTKSIIRFIQLFVEYKKPIKMSYNDNEIVILNTSLNTDNIGDDIIMHYIMHNIGPFFDGYSLYHVASHKYPTDEDVRHMLYAKAVVFCGTNIMAPRLESFSAWKFDRRCIHMNNALMVGVGWYTYEYPSKYSKFVYEHITNNDFYQSTRDGQCASMLEKAGVKRVINTGCLTCWGLDDISKDIPSKKAENVVFALTGVIRDYQNDKELLKILRQHYKKLYYWPQAIEDEDYLKSFDNLDNITILERNLDQYTQFLDSEQVDYIGTRLHGGIHAMHHLHRTIIIAIDNRAIEMGKDMNLPVIKVEEIKDKLDDLIEGTWKTKIKTNRIAINKWKEELKSSLMINRRK